MILLDTGMRKMPDKCSECKFFRVESQMYCTAVLGYTTVSKPYERRPAWCPLHEVTDTDTISRRQAIDALFEILDKPKHAEFLYTDEIARVLNQLPPSPSINPDSDTISRQAAYDTLTEYYHHKTDIQHKALAEALNRVPSTTVTADTDTISRQDAIAALKKACNGCSDDNYGVILCNAAIKVIKALPSSPSRPPWIPVTERLPKKHGESYIVTISDGAVYSAALQWDANCKRWYLSFLKDGNILVDFIEDVIAWMPLPEPYRP